MRTFKHKTLWRVAKKQYQKYIVECDEWTTEVTEAIVENWNDREEVIEKDWIYELVQFIKLTRVTEDTQEKEYREYIEKHMPRISAEELDKYIWYVKRYAKTKDYIWD